MTRPTSPSLFQSYIHGRPATAPSLERKPCLFPATGERFADMEIAGPELVEMAMESAREGLKIWRKTSAAERSRVLWRAAQLIQKHAGELSQLEVWDTGKPLRETQQVDIPSSVECLEYFAGLASDLRGESLDLGNALVYTRKEPLGVCAGIGAWNYPLQIACWKSAPALACGNAMIYKPSEFTPATTLKLAEIYTEAGLPHGVFNVILGEGKTGGALIRHPGIAKISLTGSVPTGMKVLKDAADTLKYVTLELGGKSPLVIFEDAEWDNALNATLLANFFTQGEVCSNGTRVFVHDSLYDKFVQELVKRTEKIVIGDPRQEETQFGSLISTAHAKKVLDFCKKGQEEGARLLLGGKQLFQEDPKHPFREGAFFAPTLFSECRDEMTLVREEIFGPVVSLLRFHSEEEVVERANHSPYGLAAGVFTKDIKRGHRVAAALEAGVCWVNNYNMTPMPMPFGGYKHSGLGRENGTEALRQYTQIKSVYVELGDIAPVY